MQMFSAREYFAARAFIRPGGRYLNTAIALIILCALAGHLLIRPTYMYQLWLGACVYFKRIGAIDVRHPTPNCTCPSLSVYTRTTRIMPAPAG